MQESRLLHWKEAMGVVFCCACPGKRGPPGKAQAYPEQNGTLSMTSHCKGLLRAPGDPQQPALPSEADQTLSRSR
ncbi:unnamed protein product [Caretta caretta]